MRFRFLFSLKHKLYYFICSAILMSANVDLILYNLYPNYTDQNTSIMEKFKRLLFIHLISTKDVNKIWCVHVSWKEEMCSKCALTPHEGQSVHLDAFIQSL